MRIEKIICDRCGESSKDMITNTFIRAEGNGWAKSTIVECKDFCRSCANILYKAIVDAAAFVPKDKT